LEASGVKTNLDISQLTQSVPLLLVNVAGLVFGETMQEYQPAALPMGNDLPISAALAFTSTSDPLLDKEPDLWRKCLKESIDPDWLFAISTAWATHTLSPV